MYFLKYYDIIRKIKTRRADEMQTRIHTSMQAEMQGRMAQDSIKQEAMQAVLENLKIGIVGEDENLKYILMALLSEGHVLLEGFPGVGKTKLSLALSKSIKGSFKRIQFTPDVLPSDITGYYLYNRMENCMEYREGAALCNILLADEINRASPRVQSSLLEAMEERQVTVEGKTMVLPSTFMVIATQNSIENEGTYPLPEAQLDRFFIKLHIAYPKRADWKQIMACYGMEDPVKGLCPVIGLEKLARLRAEAKQTMVTEPIFEYILDIIEGINANEQVEMGINPRGSIALLKGAKSWAYLMGRNYVLPDDIKKVAIPILAHRIKFKSVHQENNIKAMKLVESVIAGIKVPMQA